MDTEPSNSPHSWHGALRRWDHLPAGTAISAGAAIGLVIGVLLMSADWPWGLPGFIALLAGAVWLARGAEPVAVLTVPELSAELRAEPSAPELPDVDWVAIPAGRFSMGSRADDEWRDVIDDPLHTVLISGFDCLRYPVTRRLYREIVGIDPGWPKDDDKRRPINNVSWLDAIYFCNYLSERLGLTPCYHVETDAIVKWDPSADGCRLPTEAEWEYACRGGNDGRWCFGDDERLLTEYAWYAANSGGMPHPVGQKKSNAFGLHDMHGNVYEWCWDLSERGINTEEAEPFGVHIDSNGTLRGGSFRSEAGSLRSAQRDWVATAHRGLNIGFRCARGSRHRS